MSEFSATLPQYLYCIFDLDKVVAEPAVIVKSGGERVPVTEMLNLCMSCISM